MDSSERIAKALERRNEMFETVGSIVKWLIYIFGIGSVALLLFVMFAGPVSDYINYELLDKKYPTMATTPSSPIDDCNSSEDKQLCFQMKRIADTLENEKLPKLHNPSTSNAGNIWTPVTGVFDDYKYWDFHNGTGTWSMTEWNCGPGYYVVFNPDRTKYACDKEFSVDSPYFDSEEKQ